MRAHEASTGGDPTSRATTLVHRLAGGRRRVLGGVVAAVLLGTLLVLSPIGSTPAGAGPAPVMHGYIPMAADAMWGAMNGMKAFTSSQRTLDFTVGLTNAGAGAVMYYDQWEDGYEADIANPAQSTTLVFGDNNPANGNAALYCDACATDVMSQGAALVFRNDVPVPRNAATRLFDGRDKVASTRGFVITAGGFEKNRTSIQAAVVSSFDTSKYGMAYTVPVGVNTPFPNNPPSGGANPFGYTGVIVQAATAGTVVSIDRDANGTVDVTQTLAEGEATLVDDLRQGATVKASAPVQVHLATGEPIIGGGQYESRWYPLFPDAVLSSDYLSMAGSNVSNYRTINYLFNPGTASITITPTCSGCSGTITVPAGASASYASPLGQAVYFASTGGETFIGLAGVGAQSGANPGGGSDTSAYWDWGYTMIPTSQLTPQVVLGWAPGNSNNPPSSPAGDRDDNPVWITSLTATTIYVDRDGDPDTGLTAGSTCFGSRYDEAIPVTALQSVRVHDPVDGDMTGSRIYTCDNTRIAAAWGQDPSVAPNVAPGFDAGYTVMPFTSVVLDKTAVVTVDANEDGRFSPGDTVTYDILIANASSTAFTNVAVKDVLQPGMTYVPGSTVLDNGTILPIPDDMMPPSATLFPFDEGGANVPVVLAGENVHIRFDVIIDLPYRALSGSLANMLCVTTEDGETCDGVAHPLVQTDLELTKTETASPTYIGDEATFRIRVDNKGPDTATGVEVTDLLPAGTTFVSSDPSQGTYDPASGLWAVGTLANGGFATLDVVATIDVLQVENFAQVTSAQAVDLDSQPGENPLDSDNPPDQDDEDSVVVTVDPVIDLSLTKAVTAGPTGPGTTEFTITVHNDGPSEATGVEVADHAPDDAVFVSAGAVDGASFDPATQVWTIDSIAVGESVDLTITYTLPTLPTVNFAEVIAADQHDRDSTPAEDALDAENPPNEDDEDQVEISDPSADLSLTKEITDAPAFIGDEVVYEITVSNAGPGDATGVTVTDQLPAGLVHVSDDSAGSYDSVTGVWTVGTIASGADATLRITARLDVPGPVVNVARVATSDQDDPDSTPGNDDPDEDDQDEVPVSAPGASIGDFVWNDANGDGVQDADELGISGVTVRLWADVDGDDTYETDLGTKVTDGLGAYSFGDLPPGKYRVDVDESTVADGLVLTTSNEPFDVTVAGGQAVTTADFGYRVEIDLSLVKTETADPIYLGDTATFEIVVHNAGPGSATGVVVTDLLPAGLTFVSSDASQGTYDAVTGLWTVGSLASGASATLTIDATVHAETVRNFAQVTGANEFDPDSQPGENPLDADNAPDQDDEDDAIVDVASLIDLSLVKTQTGTPTHVGDDATFNITVTNAGPSDATGVVVTDVLPAGLTFVSSEATQGTYDAVTGLWTIGAIAVDETKALTVVATVTVPSVSNTAEVSAADQHDVDSTPGNDEADEDDQDTVDVVVDPLADLSLTKTVTDAPAFIGDEVVYEITVTNAGPSDATGVTVTDQLPAGLVHVSDDSAGSYDSVTGVWTVGTVGVAGGATLSVTARLDVPGPVVNVARVATSDQDDPDSTPGNDEPDEDDQDEVPVSAPGASIGDFVWNDANGDGVQDVGELGIGNVTVRLWADVDGDDTYETDLGTKVTDSSGAYLFDDLPPGKYRVDVDESTVADGLVLTTGNEPFDVTVAGGQAITTADFGYRVEIDLSLVKTQTADPVYLGDTATFEIVVTNGGPADATGVVVTDLLPAGLTFVSSEASQGTYDAVTGLWTVGSLATGASATLTVDATVHAETVRNFAQVTGANEFDPDSQPGENPLDADNAPDQDDEDDAIVDVASLIDLSLVKTQTGTPTHVGDDATFEITVTNAGPSVATGVTVTDALPAGLTFVSAGASQGSYDSATGVWTVDTIGVDGDATLTLVATVTVPSVSNTAEVSAAYQHDVDSTPGNDEADEDDQDTVDVVVDPLADLSLTKTVTDAPAFIGDEVVYEITVSNAGPSEATGVTVTDQLPAGLTFVSAGASQGSYDATTGVWTVGTVGVAGGATLSVTARLDVVGPVVNVARVATSDQDDPDSTPGNDDPDEDDQDEVPVSAPGASIGDLVWNDANGDGVQDAGELGISGVTVRLWADVDGDDTYETDLGTKVTDGLGAYSFGDLPPGKYRVDVDESTVADGLVLTTSNEPFDVTVAGGQAITTADFGYRVEIDLSLIKTQTGTPTHVGDDATFEITVTNGGPADATGVVVTDVLPAGLTFVSSDASQGTYDAVTGLWTIGAIAVDETKTLTVVATVTVPSVSNTAEVSAADQHDKDSTPGNDEADEDDQDTAGVVVDPLADLSLTKTVADAAEFLGDQVTFEITVTNAGPSEATGVTVTDQLPAGLTFVSAGASQGSYDSTTGVWTVGTVGVAGGATLSVTARLDVPGPVVNVARVATSDQDDPDSTPGNDEPDEDDQDEVPVSAPGASIGDLVWNDANGDGVQDVGELGIGNVTVRLWADVDGDDTYETDLGTKVTDSSGAYLFDDLPPGKYRVDVDESTVADGLVLTTSNEPFDVTVAGGQAITTADFGYRVEIDLSLVKTETADPIYLGDTATFEIVVHNAGPATATGVTVTDLLPAGLSFTSADATQGTYDSITGLWTVGSLVTGASATLTVDATVHAETVRNFAQVTGANEFDPDSQPGENPLDADNAPDQDDEDDAVVGVAAVIDLSLIKAQTGTPTHVGDDATFTITVTNGGPSDATGVVVTDLLPAGLTFVSSEATQGTYDAATGLWTIGAIAVDETKTLTVVATVTVPSVSNTAEVSAADQHDKDSTPGNDEADEDDQDTAGVVVDPLADLSLTKDLTVTPTHLGDEATFTITVTNAGPSDATGVVVTDQLPAGLVHLSDDSVGAYDATTGVWTVGTVASGASRTLVVTVRVDVLSAVNLAEVTAVDEDDPDSQPGEGPLDGSNPPNQDDEDSQPVTVAPLIDLSLTKTSTPETVDQLDQATFTITVANAGPSDATGVEVTDHLPAGVSFVSGVATQGSYDATTGVWTVGTIADDGSATLTIVVKVDGAGPIVNTAQVTGANEDDVDSTPGNDDPSEDDQDATMLSSDPVIDLSVAKSVSRPTAHVGSPVEYTIVVTNGGPSAATGVVVSEALPAGVTHVSHDAGQGTYDPATGLWSVGGLAVDATATLTVTVTVQAPGSIVNVTQVVGADQVDVDSQPAENPLGADDPPDQDDEAQATVVGQQIDLELDIAVDAAEVNVGDPATYVVTLTNQGPSTATGVSVHSVLPSGLTYVSSVPSQGSYDPATGTWTVGTLAPGETVVLRIVTTVEVAGPILVVAQVDTAIEPDIDSTPGNDIGSEDDQDQVLVTGLLADLSLTKTVDDTTPLVGDEVTYTLTLSNAGPSTATNIVVLDELPDGLVYVSDSGLGSYDAATGRWTVPSLADGASIELDIVVQVTALGDLANTARVDEVDQPDPDSTPGNDDPTEDDQGSVTVSPIGASIAGTVWLDADSDGTQGPDEHPIAGVTVNLLDGSGDLVASTKTDEQGHYLFDGLYPGSYTVVVETSSLPETIAGQTYDPDQVMDSSHVVVLVAGQDVVGIDFGYGPVEGAVLPVVSGPVVSGETLTRTPPAAAPSTGALPVTGAALGGLIGTALALLLAGLAFVVLGRRRRVS